MIQNYRLYFADNLYLIREVYSQGQHCLGSAHAPTNISDPSAIVNEVVTSTTITLVEQTLTRQTIVPLSLLRQSLGGSVSVMFAEAFTELQVLNNLLDRSITPLKRRAYDPKKHEAMKNEVDKLHSIDFIKEVDYLSWLVNVCLVNHLFASQIGHTMEVYVDDMLVKSRMARQHILNLSTMFDVLKHYNIHLNPTKCAFGVALFFLGFMISQRSIEANLEKIQAILDMKVPKTVKDI
ncbi:unnamed protein product [Prunus brigantina]